MVTRTTLHVNCFRLRNTAAVALLLFSTLSASALTIGRIRGAAWLGQPLDVNVQVQVESGQELAALCFEAEVFHGDARQDAGRVRMTVDGGQPSQAVQIRIQSSAAVDEPVVTVYLRETCASKTSRRFVLLSEIPPEALVASPPPLAPVVAAPASSATAATPASKAAAPSLAVVPGAGAVAQPPRTQPQPGKPTSVALAPKSTSSSAPVAVGGKKAGDDGKPVAASQPAVKPKLKLDPVDTLNERVTQLEAAAAQASQQAAASVDAAQRLQKLEQSLQSMMALAARNERGMAELREQLQQAEAEKYNNGLVYGLAGLLLAALGGLAYFWRRQRQTQAAEEAAWWDESERTPPASMSPASQVAPPLAPVSAPIIAAGAASASVMAAAEAVAPQEALATTPTASMAENAPPQGSGTVEIDLDDLLAVGAESSAAPPDMNSLAGVYEIPVIDFPSLPQAAQSDEPVEPAADRGVGIPEFPTAGNVSIDVSHLSLSPVDQLPEPQEPSAPPPPLLDFDLPGLDKSGIAEKNDPGSKS